MKIYTKTGDKGKTGLFNGERVSKFAKRVEAYGTVDELNSVVGLAIAFECPDEIRPHLEKISNMLFNLGSDLATPLDPPPKINVTRIESDRAEWLEGLIDEYDKNLDPLKNFILPGGSKCGAFLHNARTVCRRAERLVVELDSREDINPNVIILLNRLSDYFFVAARYANHLKGIKDRKWEK